MQHPIATGSIQLTPTLAEIADRAGLLKVITVAPGDATRASPPDRIRPSGIGKFTSRPPGVVRLNNAGFGETRPFEEVSTDDFRRVVETNFFGVVNLTRAALPGMRRQRSGHIIQISSVGGRSALAGNAAYIASKWAVGGFAETIALESAPFGVKVTALEPGGMRTNWGKRAFGSVLPMLPDYEASVGETIRQLEAYWGNEPSDPEKVAQVVVGVAGADHLPPHILLGSDAFQGALGADAARNAAAERWKTVSAWTDNASEGPLPDFPSE